MFLLACSTTNEPIIIADPVVVPPTTPAADPCGAAKNTCPDYAPMWTPACPAGQRCVTFTNACPQAVSLSYQIGCNGDGSAGAPQCACTAGPVLASGVSAAFTITNGDYASCLPSWTPPCLTAGLAVTANHDGQVGCRGTRIEYTAGNAGDPYGMFDSYDLDVETGYTVPVSYGPVLGACAHDWQAHDCRPLVCTSATCPDAYATPTTGGCPDGRSPQPGCQDTYNANDGYVVTFCPVPVPPSCQNAKACP